MLTFLPAGLCLLAACSIPLPQATADTTRHFLLSPVKTAADAASPAGRWIVGVRAVEVAPYLRTKAFAVRRGPNEVGFLEYTRWAEPLEDGLARVLVEDLRGQPGVAGALAAPFRADEARDFEVAVRVTACEGTADGGIRFEAQWRIIAPGSAGLVAEGAYAAKDLRWDGRDHAQLAARLSEAAAGLARAVAGALPPAPVR